jgi:hypothetical protein
VRDRVFLRKVQVRGDSIFSVRSRRTGDRVRVHRDWHVRACSTVSFAPPATPYLSLASHPVFLQQVNVTGMATGTWSFTYGSAPRVLIPTATGSLRVNASNTEVASLLRNQLSNGVYTCDNIGVTRALIYDAFGAWGWSYTITFGCPTGTPWPLLSPFIRSDGLPQPGKVPRGSSARLVSASAPLSGYFRLQYGNDTTNVTDPLPFNANGAQIAAALLELPVVSQVDVTNNGGNAWVRQGRMRGAEGWGACRLVSSVTYCCCCCCCRTRLRGM